MKNTIYKQHCSQSPLVETTYDFDTKKLVMTFIFRIHIHFECIKQARNENVFTKCKTLNFFFAFFLFIEIREELHV
jgi:hypothetical protein